MILGYSISMRGKHTSYNSNNNYTECRVKKNKLIPAKGKAAYNYEKWYTFYLHITWKCVAWQKKLTSKTIN